MKTDVYNETRRFLRQLKYIVIAVKCEDETVWAVPVKVQRYKENTFEWLSKKDTKHSKAIAIYDDIAICSFASHVHGFKEIGFYAKAQAKKVSIFQVVLRYIAPQSIVRGITVASIKNVNLR